MDYKAFLKPKGEETLVLPYFGGTRVDSADRRLRVEATDTALGWWRFQIDRRRAVPKEPATQPDLSALPAVRGHWANGWVVSDGRTLARISFPPDDEPAPLSRVVARRWYSGDLLFDTTEFEDDAELAAREALEQRRSIADVKGVVPSLRAAFAYALGMDVARELRVEVSMRELTPRVLAIADGGREAAAQAFAALVAERERAEAEMRRRTEAAQREARLGAVVAGARHVRRARSGEQRADEALEGAGARMLSCRRMARGDQLDVTYEVDGTRIISLVDAETLQVLDPGICLDGAHRVLTLDAMPSVVREAIEEDHLNITRRA